MAVRVESLPGTPALCRFAAGDHVPRLGWIQEDEVLDLSAGGDGTLDSLAELLHRAATSAAPGLEAVVADLLRVSPSLPLARVTLLPPIDRQEVWAAGVTYERSREARMSESAHGADFYWRVYDAERPEIFFKADARRSSGPEQPIRVRADSQWSVPEPELTLVLDPALRIVGFTIGNDVSARDIEGENPLYLPQAKVYQGCCALGPCIVPAERVADPYNLTISCSIERDGAVVWHDETSTGKLHRRFADLAAYLGREDSFPDGVMLMTGTSLVPPDSLSLRSGDRTTISISGLGVLSNPVA